MSKYNKENKEALESMGIDEFFKHLEAITFYEDLEYSSHKDHDIEMERNKGKR